MIETHQSLPNAVGLVLMELVCRVIIHTFYRHSKRIFRDAFLALINGGPSLTIQALKTFLGPGTLIIRIRESLGFSGPSYIVQKYHETQAPLQLTQQHSTAERTPS
jgi:hypothetical protein